MTFISDSNAGRARPGSPPSSRTNIGKVSWTYWL
jgi:hypothetical protein